MIELESEMRTLELDHKEKRESYASRRKDRNPEMPRSMKKNIQQICCTVNSYCVKDIALDRAGYLAAGLLLSKIENNEKLVLMIHELRKGNFVLNFIGGRRSLYDENPEHTAMREFDEETGFLSSLDQICNVENMLNHADVFWHCARYYLFSLQVPENMKNLDQKFNDTNKPDTLHWISVKDLLNIPKRTTVMSRTTNRRVPISDFVRKFIADPESKKFIKL